VWEHSGKQHKVNYQTLTLEDHYQNADPRPVNKFSAEQSGPRLELVSDFRWSWFHMVVFFSQLDASATAGP
jgi:hypothetical protein